MRRFLLATDKLNKWTGQVISFVVLVMLGLTAGEVICRFAFNAPTNWVYETTTQMFGVYGLIGGGYVLLIKAHIRADVLWSRLSLRGRAIADLATCGFGLLFLSVMLWFSTKKAWSATLIREHSLTPFGPPIYPIKICLVIGVFLFLLQSVVKVIRDLYLVTKGMEY